MNARSIITRDYEGKLRFGLVKNKANSKPIAGLWPEIRNKPNGYRMTDLETQFTEHDLAKQSQFCRS